MNLSSFSKYAFIFLLTFAVCPAIYAATTYTLTRGGTTTSSESTSISIPTGKWQNGDILTLYSNVTIGGQINTSDAGKNTVTVKSGNSTRYTITASGTGYRFTDFASGTYNLENVAFSNFGPQNGAIFYRNDGSGQTSTYI